VKTYVISYSWTRDRNGTHGFGRSFGVIAEPVTARLVENFERATREENGFSTVFVIAVSELPGGMGS
jgi:hypothetical protein